MNPKFIVLCISVCIAINIVLVALIFWHDVLYKIANFLFKRKKYEQAAKIYQRVLGTKENYGYAGFNQGMSFFKVNDYVNAKRSFNAFLEANPRSYEALYNLGLLSLIDNNTVLAKDYFEKVLEIKSDDIDSIYQVAIINFAQGDYFGAMNYFEKAAKLHPDNKDYKYCALRSRDMLCDYNNEGEINEIIRAYEEFLPNRSELSSFSFESSYVQALAKAGKIDDVIKYATEFIPDAHDQCYMLHKFLGLAYFIKQNYVKALENFIISQQSASDPAEINFIIAQYYSLRGDPENYEYYKRLAGNLDEKESEIVVL